MPCFQSRRLGDPLKRARGKLACIAAFLLILPVEAQAAEVTLNPWLKVRGEYDDNVLFTRTVENDDYLATMSPGLELTYATSVMSLHTNLNVDVLRYLDETELNTENQRYAVDGTFGFVERLKLRAGLLYIDDTTLDSQLEETGVVGIRSDRKRFEGNGGLDFQITEVSQIRLDYTYLKTDYDFRGYQDYSGHTVVLNFNHRLGTGKDTLAVQPYYTEYDSDVSHVKDLGLYFGWVHAFFENMDLSAYLGVRRSDTDYQMVGRSETEKNWGGVGDIVLKYTGELSVWSLGYLADLRYGTYGEPINVHRGYGSVNYRLTERFGTNLAASYYYTKSEGDLPIRYENSRYMEVRPMVFYRITENHRVELGYLYGREYDKTVTAADKTADRNRVWLSFNFSYPTKW